MGTASRVLSNGVPAEHALQKVIERSAPNAGASGIEGGELERKTPADDLIFFFIKSACMELVRICKVKRIHSSSLAPFVRPFWKLYPQLQQNIKIDNKIPLDELKTLPTLRIN